MDVEKDLTDCVGLDSEFDCAGDQVSLVGRLCLGGGVARPAGWALLFLDLVALRMT